MFYVAFIQHNHTERYSILDKLIHTVPHQCGVLGADACSLDQEFLVPQLHPV